MNVLISVEHPAWAHQFRYMIKTLQARGDSVTVLAIDKDGDLSLLSAFGIDYIKVSDSTGDNPFQKAWLLLKLSVVYAYYAYKTKSNVLIGRASPMMSIAAFLTHKPHLIYDDIDNQKFVHYFGRHFSTKVFTPMFCGADYGKKQHVVDSYKELFYLHPDYFVPDKEKLRRYGITVNEPYIVLRFVAHKANHDFGIGGFSSEDKIALLETVSEFGKVYISSEGELPKELEQYRLKLPYEDIHHLLYFATLVVGDSATMTSEAAVLGTHAVYWINVKPGTISEQENKYKLVKLLNCTEINRDTMLCTVRNMLENEQLFYEGKEKRKKLLAEKIDMTTLFLKEMDQAVGKRVPYERK